MGFVPVLIAISGFFFLWGGVMFHTFRKYRNNYLAALSTAKSYASSQGISTSVAGLSEKQIAALAGSTDPQFLKLEIEALRKAKAYNKLVNEPPYKVFAKVMGF